MDKLQKFNDKILKMNNKVFKFDPPVYNVNILSSEHGSISASPVSGYPGTTVTLSNMPDSGYNFINYEVNGANLYDGNKFDLFKSDVTVQGNFTAYKDRYEYTLYENASGIGVSSGSVNSAFSNYDSIGIRMTNDTNTNTPRKTRGANWIWFTDEAFKGTSGSYWLNYTYTDGANFNVVECLINYNNSNLTFSISVPNTNLGWRMYTFANSNARLYGAYSASDIAIINKIVGVKYQ